MIFIETSLNPIHRVLRAATSLGAARLAFFCSVQGQFSFRDAYTMLSGCRTSSFLPDGPSINFYFLICYKCLFRVQQDGSVGKALGTKPEFDSQDPHRGRKEGTPKSYPLTSRLVPSHMHTRVHIYMYTHYVHTIHVHTFAHTCNFLKPFRWLCLALILWRQRQEDLLSVQSQPGLYIEFQASHNHTARPYLKKEKRKVF